MHDAAYWQKRYDDKNTGWDLSQVSTPIKVYCDQLEDKSLSILIPGAGNGYEAEYLVNQGFVNVSALDFAESACENLRERVGENNHLNIICDDFFKHQGIYDLIIEQTMFCALHPDQRHAYVEKIYSLLTIGGKYVGLLFASQFEKQGPPYGGQKSEYLDLFLPLFKEVSIEPCYNSIAPRAGNELWISMKK